MRDEGFGGMNWTRPERWTVVARILVSLASACVLSAAALVGVWVLETVYSLFGDRWALGAFFVAAVLEGGILARIWKPVRTTGWASAVARPLVLTSITVVATIIGCALAEVWVRGDDELIMGAVGLLGGAGVLMIWLPALNRLLVGQKVVSEEDTVNVFCPECGYSLVGLRDLRCPECGVAFTIDALIRSQNYSGGQRTWRVVGREADSIEGRPPISGAS